MTGVEALTERILDDARQQASEILREAERKIAQEEEKARRAIAHHADEIIAHAREKGAEAKQRLLAVHSLELRKELLAVKREAMDKAYAAALSRLESLPREEYLALVQKLLAENAAGSETVRVSKTEKYIDAAFLEGVNAARRASGKTGALRLGGAHADIGGGFLLESGGLIVDCSFKTVVNHLREATETQVAQILFGAEG